jgi:hypothetical protein
MTTTTDIEGDEGVVYLTVHGEAFGRIDHIPGSAARWWIAPSDEYAPFNTVAIEWVHLTARGPLTVADSRLTRTVITAVREQLGRVPA